MNWDQIRGNWKQMTGKMKQRLGRATGNERMVRTGQVDQFAGKVREGYGSAKEKVDDSVQRNTDSL